MKVVTLNSQKDDCWETEVLFVFSDINSVDNSKFLEKIKEGLHKYLGSIYYIVKEETVEKYANLFLNELKAGKDHLFIEDYLYIDTEEVDVL